MGHLEVWLSFVCQINRKVMLTHFRGLGQIHTTLETDSCGSWGCAGILVREYITMQWPMSVSRNNLALLEFYPMLVSVFIWSERLCNKRLEIGCDNLATVYIINKCIFTLQCL